MLGKMRSRAARSGCDFTISRLQELLNARIHGDREPLHIIDRNVAFTALNRADVGAVQARFFGEIFLGYSQCLPLLTQVLAKNLSNASLAAHESMLDNVMPLRLQT